MAKYLWSKDESGDAADSVQSFLSGDDVVLDRELFLYDIQATLAHASALHQLGVFNREELEQVRRSLAELAGKFQAGQYTLEAPFEDGHSAIEHWLSNSLGDTGDKIHTGRSRNDQVQVAMRLYVRDRLDQLVALCVACSEAFLDRARADEWTPMPGYTHLQRAVPSSVGLWMASFAESFIDIAQLGQSTRTWINRCPLGTAAGYGVNAKLDRQLVANQLEFEDLQLNPMYVQNSRGRYELQALGVLAQATLELRRFSWDLSLYTSSEFDFVRLGAIYSTGSSIMPNKSNPDTVELLRGQHAVVQGAMSELQATLSLPSGYHRDLQVTKPPVIRAFHTGLSGIGLVPDLVNSMQFNKPKMLAAIDPDMFATDIAVQRVMRDGVPFRQSYRTAATAEELAEQSAESSLRDRVSPGACGDLQLDVIEERINQFAKTNRDT